MKENYVRILETDVAVLGAGTSGLCAAIEAAREGMQVVLIEGSDRLGGIMSVCQGMPLGCGYPCQKSVGGIFKEYIDSLMAQDPPAAWIRLLPDSAYGWDVYYNQDIAMAKFYQMLEDAGVHLILRAYTGEVMMDKDEVAGIEYHDVLGTSLLKAKVYIDCTGNGDIAARAGVPYEVGDEQGHMMAGTLTFIMANVDTDAAFPTQDKECHNFQADELVESGAIPEGIKTIYYTRNANPGQVFFNWAMAREVDGLDPESILQGSNKARKYILALADYLRKNVPAFKNAYLDRIGPLVGIRDTRRFEGMYYLTEQDLMSRKKFPGSGIVCCDNVFDEAGRGADGAVTHDSIVTVKNSDYYQIPFETLVPKKIRNLMFAGRIMSADARAMTSSRGMASCMIMGQATGAASVMAIHNHTAVQEVSPAEVVKKLQQLGVAGLGDEAL